MMALTRLERWTLRLWIIAALTSVVAFALPDLAATLEFLLIVLIITLPVALFIAAAPTITLYLSVAGSIYLAARRWSRLGAALAAAAITAAVGIAVPLAANRAVSDRAVRFAANDRAGRITIPRGATVAYLTDTVDASGPVDDRCEEICQRLLFSGVAGAVLLGPLTDPRGATRLTRHSIAPSLAGRCPAARRTAVPADDRDVGADSRYPRPTLADSLVDAEGTVRCQTTDTATLTSAGIIIVHDNDWAAQVAERRRTLRLPSASFQRVGVYVREAAGLRLAVRRSSAAANLLTVPLVLHPPMMFETNVPADWGRRIEPFRSGRPLPGSLLLVQSLITNDLRVAGLTPAGGGARAAN